MLLSGVQVDAVVLESPYNSIREAAAHVPITTVSPAWRLSPLSPHPISGSASVLLSPGQIYRQFPGFEYLILDSIALANMFFRNDEK